MRRGIKIPLGLIGSGEFMSRIAEASGVGVPIPTLVIAPLGPIKKALGVFITGGVELELNPKANVLYAELLSFIPLPPTHE